MNDSAPRIHIQRVETLTLSKHAAVIEAPDWADEPGGDVIDQQKLLQGLAVALTRIEAQLELLIAHTEDDLK